MKNWIIAALVAALALSLVAGVVAQAQGQAQRTATVQLRLWESSADPSENYISIRDDNGAWTPGTPPLLLDDGLSPGGRYRYGDLTIESTVPDPVPLGLEVTDTSCYRGQFNAYLTLHGWVRNLTDATLSNVAITAALRDRTGVEVAQGAAIVTARHLALGEAAVRHQLLHRRRRPGHVPPPRRHLRRLRPLRHPLPRGGRPMMKNWIIAALAVALALSIAGVVVAQTQRTATVEVRIFESVRDPSVHYIASRPQGGPWTATERLSPFYDGFVQGGRYRFRDVFVNATVPQPLPSGIELVGPRLRGPPAPRREAPHPAGLPPQQHERDPHRRS